MRDFLECTSKLLTEIPQNVEMHLGCHQLIAITLAPIQWASLETRVRRIMKSMQVDACLMHLASNVILVFMIEKQVAVLRLPLG